MKPVSSLCLFILLVFSASAHAQLYKSVGPDGKVSYSDVPPAAAKPIGAKSVGSESAAAPALPFELAEAARNHPVTLYTTKECQACDQGRSLLTGRGVPFSEKTVGTNEDIAHLTQLASTKRLPVLLVGRNQLKGYAESTWNEALSAAKYPETSKLPKTYRNPAPVPAVPVAEARKPSEPVAAGNRAADDIVPAAGNAPPGFRF
jgi:glutaredoxin